MKGNNGTGNTIERDEWQTPQGLFDTLNKQYNFTHDCCATVKNKKCFYFISDFEKIYKENDTKNIHWMNPPFSKAFEMFEHFFKVVNQGVAIYRCDNMENILWQEVILKNASWIFIPKGRIKYEGFAGTHPRFASALIGYNVLEPKGLDGTLLIIGGK